MDVDSTGLNYNEFLAFVLLYAAKANLELKEEELEYIHGKVSDKEFNHVKKIFDYCNDYQCLQIIDSYHDQYLDTEEKRDQVLRDIHEVFESDHQLEMVERIYERMLKKIL